MTQYKILRNRDLEDENFILSIVRQLHAFFVTLHQVQ